MRGAAQPTAGTTQPDLQKAGSPLVRPLGTTPASASPSDAQPAMPEGIVARYSIACSLTGSINLGILAADADNRTSAKPRASLGCSARATDRLSVRLALIGYANPADQAPWDPDYSYAFTFRLNDTLSLGYSNYSARFTSEGGAVRGLFDGKVRATARLPAIPLPNDKTIPCSLSIGLPQPARESLNLSCGYAVTPKLRIGATAHVYAPGAQGTYQPDFSYTASYQIGDQWRLSYANYSNNRWPWNRNEAASAALTGGSISLTRTIRF